MQLFVAHCDDFVVLSQGRRNDFTQTPSTGHWFTSHFFTNHCRSAGPLSPIQFRQAVSVTRQ